MSDATRLAVTAATVMVVAIGGLYFFGLSLPGPGDPGTTPTPIPSVSASQASIDLGTITLLDDGCRWGDNPGSVPASSDPLGLKVVLGNETDTFANFGIYRLDDGYPWDDAAAWIIRENEAMQGGPSQPPQDFATEVGSLDQPTRGQSPPANLVLGPGVYGIVCSSNEPPPFPGDVYAIYLVGPLEITEP